MQVIGNIKIELDSENSIRLTIDTASELCELDQVEATGCKLSEALEELKEHVVLIEERV